MSEKWKRPENLEFPKIYHKFLAKDFGSEGLVDYYIQDLPVDRYEEAIKFTIEHYTPDEPIFASRNARDDPGTIKDFSNLWRQILETKISQVCFKSGSNEIIGVNLIDVDVKNVSVEVQGSAKNFLNQCEICDYCLEKSKLFETFKLDKYIRTCELSVHKNYRYRGIATEMLRAMKPTMEFLGFDLVTSGFSAVGSAKAGLKAGYRLVFEMPFEKFPDINPELSYPGIKSPSYKQMIMKRF